MQTPSRASGWFRKLIAAMPGMLVLILLESVAPDVRADCYDVVILKNPNLGCCDNMGHSVAGVGDNALVGAPGYSQVTPGYAFLFDGTTGELIKSFNNPSPTQDDKFGYALASTGKIAIISAPGDDTDGSNKGRVYFFDADPLSAGFGSLIRTLPNPHPAGSTTSFGGHLAVDGTRLIATSSGVGSGSIDVIDIDLNSPTFGTSYFSLSHNNIPISGSNDGFGAAVAALDGLLVVGASRQDWGTEVGAGAAYSFNELTGQYLATIRPTPPQDTANFGTSVAMFGNYIAGGAPNADGTKSGEGNVVLFDRATGTVAKIIKNPHATSTDHFGESLAVVNGDLLIGAPKGVGASDVGRAYLYHDMGEDGGAIVATFLNPHTPEAPGARFGYSVAAIGSKCLIGAPHDDTRGSAAGAAFIFTGHSENCPPSPTPTPSPTPIIPCENLNIVAPTPYFSLEPRCDRLRVGDTITVTCKGSTGVASANYANINIRYDERVFAALPGSFVLAPLSPFTRPSTPDFTEGRLRVFVQGPAFFEFQYAGDLFSFQVTVISGGTVSDLALKPGEVQWGATTPGLLLEGAVFDIPGPRGWGDLDGSGCTDISDTLLLLDYWLQEFEGAIISIPDFLNMLDYWQTGPECP